MSRKRDATQSFSKQILGLYSYPHEHEAVHVLIPHKYKNEYGNPYSFLYLWAIEDSNL